MSVRKVTTLAATALFIAVPAACGASSQASPPPVTVFDVSADPGRGLPAIDPKHPATFTSATLGSTLDSLLTKHATLVAALAHRVVAGDPSPTSSIAALATNSHSLTRAVALVYGRDAARAFAQLWEKHTQFFVDYAHAVHVHDRAAQRLAQAQLLDYQSDFAGFVSTATDGRASLVAVTGLLHGHVHDLTSYIDADEAGRDDQAQQILDEAVAHMRVIARAISDAIDAQHPKTVVP